MNPTTFNFDVFLAYAPRDGFAIAERLHRDLIAVGLRVWWDTDGQFGYGSGLTDMVAQGIQASRYFVLVLTPATMREDSATHGELATTLRIGRQPIPIMAIDCLLPAQLFGAPWIDFRANYDAGVVNLRAALAGCTLPNAPTVQSSISVGRDVSGNNVNIGSTQYIGTQVITVLNLPPNTPPVPVLWRIYKPPADTPPQFFVGRKGILNPIRQALTERVTLRRARHHLIGGAHGTGKTALLNRVKTLVDLDTHYILHADLSPQGAQTGADYHPLTTAVGQLWQQLLSQCPGAQRTYRNITHPEQISNVLIWLEQALNLAGHERLLLLLLDNVHLDADQVLIKWLNRSLKPLPLTVIATYLKTDLTASLTSEYWTAHELLPLMPFELAELFDPPERDYGQRLHKLSDGRPAVVELIAAEWLRLGQVTRSESGLVVESADDLNDVWESLIEEKLLLAAQNVELIDKYEIDTLFDWLTCAAVEGITFSEAGLLGATADDIDPADGVSLLKALCADELAFIEAVPPTLPISTACYRFSPPGLRDFILDNARLPDITYYALRVFDVLEAAAMPYPFALRAHLVNLAQMALDYQLAALQEQGDLLPTEIGQQLRDSEAAKRLAHYQGYLERERRIFGLKMQLAVIPIDAHSERWPLLKAIGIASRRYENDDDTAATFRAARAEALLASTMGHEIATLYYYEQVFLANLDARRALLEQGWLCLPKPLRHMELDQMIPETLFAAFNREEMQSSALLFSGTGDLCGLTGNKHQALLCYKQALSLQRAIDDYAGEAMILHNIGVAYDALGEYTLALEFLEQALPLHRAFGDRPGEVFTLYSIGAAYNALGEHAHALKFYQQALPLHRVVGDRKGEAITLNDIGVFYTTLGEHAHALEFYQQALPLHRAVGNPRGEARTQHNIGMAYKALGEYMLALEFFEQALALFRALGDRNNEANTLNGTGMAHTGLERWDDAINNLQVAVALAEQIQHIKLSWFRANLEAVKQEHAKAFSENSNNFLTN